MKKLTLFLFLILFAFALQGQKVITYQGDVSLMDAGKGTFDVGTESWFASGGFIENDAGALKVTYVSASTGAYHYLRATFDINTNLVVGKTYKIRVKCKVNAGSLVGITVTGPSVTIATFTETDFVWKSGIFVATNATTDFVCTSFMGAGEIIWIDEWSIQEWYPNGRVITYDGKVIRQD